MSNAQTPPMADHHQALFEFEEYVKQISDEMVRRPKEYSLSGHEMTVLKKYQTIQMIILELRSQVEHLQHIIDNAQAPTYVQSYSRRMNEKSTISINTTRNSIHRRGF